MTGKTAFGQAFAYGVAGAGTALRAQRWTLTALAAVALGVGVVASRTPVSNDPAATQPYGILAAGGSCLGLISLVVVLVAAVRLEVPTVRIGVGNILMVVAFGWFYVAVVAAGIVAFVVPGVYAAGKLAPMPLYAFLGGGAPFADAIRATNGRFWATVALIAILWLGSEAALVAIYLVASLVPLLLPAIAIVTAPLAFACACYVQAVALLTWVHYCLTLQRAAAV